MTSQWLEPWHPVEGDAVREDIKRQLAKEIGASHPLAGLSLRVIAKRSDQDDILVELDVEDGKRVAEVHLTWSQNPHRDARWPRTKIFESIDQWKDDSMVPTHEDWSGA